MRKSFVILAAAVVAGMASLSFAGPASGTRNNEVYGGPQNPTLGSSEALWCEQFETGLPSASPLPNHGPPGAGLALSSGTWHAYNASVPIGTTGVFRQGGAGAPFPAAPGNGTFYAAMNFNSVAGANPINTFLMSPVLSLNDGDIISFQTRTVTSPAFPDRLHLKLSSSGAASTPAAFGAAVLTINPTLTTTGYPSVWTTYSYTLSGFGSASGRFAFNYEMPDGGPLGNNSDFIGIDNVCYTPIPEPASLGLACVAGLGLLARRRS